ncbi:MAG: hypothetical protein Q7K57_26640 [Burkholderiaceae bacterium]|nr:hypothetical protein [Burkholderiaceae bacterium]
MKSISESLVPLATANVKSATSAQEKSVPWGCTPKAQIFWNVF